MGVRNEQCSSGRETVCGKHIDLGSFLEHYMYARDTVILVVVVTFTKCGHRHVGKVKLLVLFLGTRKLLSDEIDTLYEQHHA